MWHLFDLTGRVAIVTGASTGLGRAMAVALAEAGADVAGVARSDQSETAAAVEAAGSGYHAITADLAGADKAAVLAEAVEVFGRVDILVNNAGTIRRADAVDFTEADWDAVMDLNLKAAFFLSQAFARNRIAAGEPGKIVNIASMLSFQGGIRVPSYTASKHGILGLTRLMANEWAKHRIGVNAIAPGYMVTDNTAAIRADPGRHAEITARIPAGRWGEAADLAGAVVFLASGASDYVQGAVLPVDGGWLAR
ncbi:2-dehydro-3-deoxy-D-gluconate 5-dehydrogenase KduD [Prosthecomicrobium sp. N25]|uniref:2-dehydro-3-deoxy-D-gluconate 5-dehydrogenase KduD n=1 Tax=Prosthecomicrobium sp. N25 TaxID=3129254 RepID=UPI0030770262